MTTTHRERPRRLARAAATTAVMLLAVATGACRAERVAAIRDAHLRPAIAGSTTAGYFVLDNVERDTLVVDSVTAAVAAAVELHETTIDSTGVARMRPAGTLAVPPDSAVTLRPGGLHLMVIGVRRDLRAGERVPMTVWLRGGRALTASAEVRAP